MNDNNNNINVGLVIAISVLGTIATRALLFLLSNLW